MKKWIFCFLLAGIGLCSYSQTKANDQQPTKVTKVKTKSKTVSSGENAAMQSTVNTTAANTTKHVAHKKTTSATHKTAYAKSAHKKTAAAYHKKSPAVAHKSHVHSGMSSSMTSSSSNAAKSSTSSGGGVKVLESQSKIKTKIKTPGGKETKRKTVTSSSPGGQ